MLLYIFFLSLIEFYGGRGERYWGRYIPTLLAISQTNHVFRELVLNDSRFWSTLTISMFGPCLRPTSHGFINLFKLFIKRSGERSLNYGIEVHTNQDLYNDIIELLLREQHRWQSVTIYIFDERKVTRSNFQMRMTNMPLLQKLSLTFHDSKDRIEGPFLDFSNSKQLRCLDLDIDKHIEWKKIAETIHSQQLTEFKLRIHTNPSDIDFIVSLGLFTNLTRLEIINRKNVYSIFEHFSSSPPILLPNLRFLELYLANHLLKCFITPSLVSLGISHAIRSDINEGGLILYEYLQRSNPPLETLKLEFSHLPNRNLLRNILRQLSTVQTFIIKHSDECFDPSLNDLHDYSQINDLWSLLSINSPSTGCLLPNLSRLAYYRSCQDAYKRRKEQVIIIADMLVSRWKYSPDFCFQGKHEYVREGPSKNFYCLLENMKNIRDCVSNGCSMIIKDRHDDIEED